MINGGHVGTQRDLAARLHHPPGEAVGIGRQHGEKSSATAEPQRVVIEFVGALCEPPWFGGEPHPT